MRCLCYEKLTFFAGAFIIFYLLKVVFDSFSNNELFLWRDDYFDSLIILAIMFLLLYLFDKDKKESNGD